MSVNRALLTGLVAAVLVHAWTMSVEFPYGGLPPETWERGLAHLKEMGVSHVSLPPSADPAQLNGVIRIVRRLGLEADLEGPIPVALELQAKAHGGPLTAELAGAIRVSATMPRALDNERKLLTGGTQAILWTDVFETLWPAYHRGVISLAGLDKPEAGMIRREAQLARAWGSALADLSEAPGAKTALAVEGVSVHQYIGPNGLSFVAVINDTADAWTGELRVMYPAIQRAIALAGVSVPARDVLWLPVNVPLANGPLCAACTKFAPGDHVAYATAELTGMEYENGILAMEFIARSPGEVVIHLSHEPEGPLVAAGRPIVFDWDAKNQRARLPIPAGNAVTGRVRVALAIDAPQATAMFAATPVLLIGESNRLKAQFSPVGVAVRSRLLTAPELAITREEETPPKDAAGVPEKRESEPVTWNVAVPAGAIAGDTVQLAIEADGIQISHSQQRLLLPVMLNFEDAVAIRVAVDSRVPLTKPSIAVNQKPGREIVMTIRNNAPEIRTFHVALHVPGLDFSPADMTVSVGASVARDVTFRVFSSTAAPGVHEGEVNVTGAAALTQHIRFVVIPAMGMQHWSADGFQILENATYRATFLAGTWLELIDKSTGEDLQPPGGTAFAGGPVESVKMEDLLQARIKQK